MSHLKVDVAFDLGGWGPNRGWHLGPPGLPRHDAQQRASVQEQER